MRKIIFILSYISMNAYADPLVDFKSIVKRCQQAYDSRPSVVVDFNVGINRWVKHVYAPVSVTYDVRQTDSLVFPLEGHIEITDKAAAEESADEESAKTLDLSLDGKTITRIRRISYTFSDGRWTPGSANLISHFKRSPDDTQNKPFSLRESPDDLKKLKGPVASCLNPKP